VPVDDASTSLITLGFSIYKFFRIEIAKSTLRDKGFLWSAHFAQRAYLKEKRSPSRPAEKTPHHETVHKKQSFSPLSLLPTWD
jgi:hypothetical protein